MKFSIILTTINRLQDLRRFFESLRLQSHTSFEVFVVDHELDARTIAILEEFEQFMPISYLGSAAGHSKALNIGLRRCTGDVLAFPDDDCWYGSDLLNRVAQILSANPDWCGLTGRVVTETGEPSSGRWDRTAGPITKRNAWGRATTVSMFFRREAVAHLFFDETLGVGAGTLWGAGEETDYLLRALDTGRICYYDPSVTVLHPQIACGPYTPAVCKKAHSYARGVGYVLRKHGYAMHEFVYHAFRPFGGAVLSVLCGRFRKAAYHWAICEGRITGYFSREGSIALPELSAISISDEPGNNSKI